MKQLTRNQILKAGFVIDDHCYPPVAYKGSKFDTTEAFETLTELEEKLTLAARELITTLDNCPGEFNYDPKIEDNMRNVTIESEKRMLKKLR